MIFKSKGALRWNNDDECVQGSLHYNRAQAAKALYNHSAIMHEALAIDIQAIRTLMWFQLHLDAFHLND